MPQTKVIINKSFVKPSHLKTPSEPSLKIKLTMNSTTVPTPKIIQGRIE